MQLDYDVTVIGGVNGSAQLPFLWLRENTPYVSQSVFDFGVMGLRR